MSKSFLFVGGDLRSLYAAKKLSFNNNVHAYGFDDENLAVPPICLLDSTPQEKYDYIVLPLPASSDNLNINSPYFSKEIPIDVIPFIVKKNGVVLTGKSCDRLNSICKQNDIDVIDYFEREELVVMNAVPTAEGALQIAMQESAFAMFKSEILITGFGRISKVLVKYLTALGANVTITARKYSDLAWAEIMGCKSIHLSNLKDFVEKFDIIINTIPAVIFDKQILSLLSKGCLVIDLASKAGVVDFETAKNLGIKTIWALSLPGKVAPITAGEIIADTIINIIAERRETCE